MILLSEEQCKMVALRGRADSILYTLAPPKTKHHKTEPIIQDGGFGPRSAMPCHRCVSYPMHVFQVLVGSPTGCNSGFEQQARLVCYLAIFARYPDTFILVAGNHNRSVISFRKPEQTLK